MSRKNDTSQPKLATESIVPRPRLALRLGFAGRQKLTEDAQANLEAALYEVYSTVGGVLAGIAPGVPVKSARDFAVAKFYSDECPVLRVITGLCEGADATAAKVLELVPLAADPESDSAGSGHYLETELAAVLPFDVASYRESRPDWFKDEFDQQLQRCAWVLELDGIYDDYDKRLDEETEYSGEMRAKAALARQRRRRGYRAQGAFLLRQSDILIAAADPDVPGSAGGTLETVREALHFELPIVFVHTGKSAVYLIEPDEDINAVLAEPPLVNEERTRKLGDWVERLTTDPTRIDPTDKGQLERKQEEQRRQQVQCVLGEFFDDARTPPTDASGRQMTTWRGWLWSRVEAWFRPDIKLTGETPLFPYSAYRSRATSLNYHYSGLYRGAFVSNYMMAISAVSLAAISLLLLGTAGHTDVGESVATLLEQAGHHPKEVAVSPKPQPWLLPVLIGLAMAKLLLLMLINRNTRRANGERWSDRAVDLRYLAERLRTMYYLPQAGSFQPPSATPPQFASRVARQSAVDWLFEAIIRAVSPADLNSAEAIEVDVDGKSLTVRRLMRPDPMETVRQVRDVWIEQQANYHDRVAQTMHSLSHRLEEVSKWLGWIVVTVVFVDIVLILGKVGHWFPHGVEPYVKAATPWLIFISAVLPAVVAALSGIRSQSECERLAERSRVMRTILRGHEKQRTQTKDTSGTTGMNGRGNPSPPQGRKALGDALYRRIEAASSNESANVGGWAHESLRLTERIATDFVQEATEWSVLYAKEVSDPG